MIAARHQGPAPRHRHGRERQSRAGGHRPRSRALRWTAGALQRAARAVLDRVASLGCRSMSSQDVSDEPRRLRAAIRLVLRRYARQVRARPWLAAMALVLPGIGNIFVHYAPPLAIAHLLAMLAHDSRASAGELATPVLALAVAWFGGEVIWRVAGLLVARLEYHAIRALYIEAMDELFAKDVGFFHNNFAGSLTKRVLGYARRFEDVFDVFAFSICGSLFPLAFAVVVLAQFSGWLIVVLLSMLAIAFFCLRPLIRRRHQLVQIREQASNALAGHVADSITNAETVRAFAREREEAAIHARNVHDFTAKMLRSWDYQNKRVDIVTSPLYVLTNTMGLAVALAIGHGSGFAIEAVFLTFSYFAQSTRVMWEFNRIYRNLESSFTDAAQFTELLLEPPALVDPDPAEVFAPRDASVRLRSVRFAYPSRPPLFDGFDLAIAPGEKVGLVGRSGGGKTTLTRLLLRFADIDSGAIEIGGQNIARVRQAALRDSIAIVPQEPAMFHRTIADNIRFARPTATDLEVHRAAELAHAAEFIAALPAGYGTLVGERGIKLSGGQRQRIAIARAILKNAPILILDEATSALDSESEKHIQQALWALMRDRTAIVIAHRLSTVRRMDRLVVIEGGRIIEQGRHDQLLALGGQYAALWDHQSGGFLQELAG
ncbi:MAG TPA: ABC transporter ATP-binding protein [Kofleriaceae bacterium]|nr:ABC transporter ATP-binding protein [Kofleriaceae bacterium]